MIDLWEFLEPEYRRVAVIRTEECEELLGEVKALVDTEQVLRDHIAILKDLNNIQAGLIRKRESKIYELRTENVRLAALVALAETRKTLGGIPHGVTPDWTPNPGSPAKFDGAGPPPYSPAIETGRVES